MLSNSVMTGKRLLNNIVLLVGTLLLLDAVAMCLMMNFNFGLVELGLFSVALIIYGLLWRGRKVAKWMHFLVIIVCMVIVSFSGFLAVYGHNDNARYDEDAVIVLGAGLRGEEVSPTLARRLDKAVDYYGKNPGAVFVVSGGQGTRESITEALAMERYLLKKGIPAGQIIKEQQSTSTYENFLFSGGLLKEKFPDGYSAVFITNGFHVYRAERTANLTGIAPRHIWAGVAWYSVPINYMREMAAVAKFWLIPPAQLKSRL